MTDSHFESGSSLLVLISSHFEGYSGTDSLFEISYHFVDCCSTIDSLLE